MSPPASPPAAGARDASKSPSPPPNGSGETASDQAERESESPSTAAADSDAPASVKQPTAHDGPPLPSEPTPDEPPVPNEPAPEGPPLPQEAPPSEDDGWDCQWDPSTQAWFFYNRFTGKTQWDNPRVPVAGTEAAPGEPKQPAADPAAVTGYNPAIHGDYDPNAWYARGYKTAEELEEEERRDGGDPGADAYATTAQFNRFTGQFQSEDMGPGRHTDEAKSRRQLNAFFDVDAAANSHDGRSLRAERSNKKPSKAELKAFKEKRKARKEEKRRAWLRD